MSELPFFSEQDDRPHPPGDDPLWQESLLFTWYDRSAGVGGFWRLGQEVVACAVNSCWGVFTDDGLRFRSNITGLPLDPADRGEAHMGWGPHLRATFDGGAAIRADFPDCEADLRFDDFHPRFDFNALARGVTLAGAAHHFEVAGRVTGRIRIGDREIAVDAYGHRDRSWARRDWAPIRSTRWWPCVFGPDLSLHVIHVLRAPGDVMRLGYLWRGGKAQPIVDSDLVVGLESDACTPRNGHGMLRLADGEMLDVRFERSDAIVMHVRGYTAVEAIGRAWLDGREGFSTLEVCTNATAGTAPPGFTLGSNNTDGLSRRP